MLYGYFQRDISSLSCMVTQCYLKIGIISCPLVLKHGLNIWIKTNILLYFINIKLNIY